jgi:hypothetical protein
VYAPSSLCGDEYALNVSLASGRHDFEVVFDVGSRYGAIVTLVSVLLAIGASVSAGLSGNSQKPKVYMSAASESDFKSTARSNLRGGDFILHSQLVSQEIRRAMMRH